MKNNDILFCTDEMIKNHRKAMGIDYEIHRDLKVEIVPNGIIHPLEVPEGGREEYLNYGGVTDENLNFIKLSLMERDKAFSVSENDYDKMFIGANPNRDFSNIDYIDEVVVYIGPMHRHIAHFYLECFSRWWYFLDSQNLKYKIAYMPMIGGLTDWHSEFFELMGIKTQQVISIDKPIKFKSVIVPEQSMCLNLSYHQKYKELFDKIAENIKPLHYKKVYFSKVYGGKAHISFSLADEIYTQNGYKVLYTECLSVKDMIAALKNCEEFVSQSGSNAHNAIFCGDNAKVTILNRSAHFHPCQTMINRLRNLQVTYVDVFCKALPVDWSSGPFIFLYTDELKKYLVSNDFKYNAKKLERDSFFGIKKYLNLWVELYTESELKCNINNLNLDKNVFVKFVSFMNTYLSKIYKQPYRNKIADERFIENKSYLFGLINKQVDKHRPSKTRWKIFGKEILRYKTKMI